MKTQPPDALAFDVALKLRHGDYLSEDRAVAALRRRCRGLSVAAASRLLHSASAVLETAIEFITPHTESFFEIYRTQGTVSSADVLPFDAEFRQLCPKASRILRARALWNAVIYHLR